MNEIMGKTALITGAAGGIGAATARLFAREGALLLILSDVNKQALEDLAEEIHLQPICPMRQTSGSCLNTLGKNAAVWISW